MTPQHFKGHTFHKRKGSIRNAFNYNVDYVLCDPSDIAKTPALFSHNRGNVSALHDVDNGGPRGAGRGAAWVRETLREAGMHSLAEMRILLLTQPRVFGHVFNPVSFWLITDETNQLRGAIAEVNNTFGERHTYLCAQDDLRPLVSTETVSARKLFYVSPFQPVEGAYNFRFSYSESAIGIRIDLQHADGGLVATLTGHLQPLTSFGILKAAIARPFGSLRVLALIYYQAVKLRLKGAKYRPHTPTTDIEASK